MTVKVVRLSSTIKVRYSTKQLGLSQRLLQWPPLAATISLEISPLIIGQTPWSPAEPATIIALSCLYLFARSQAGFSLVHNSGDFHYLARMA